MKKIYHLSTCSTCVRILKELNLDDVADAVTLQDIKTDAITSDQLHEMYKIAGSYEALFSRRSMKYKAWNLKEKNLEESEYRKYILEEYTFLKRPVAIINGDIYIGNDKKTVAKLIEQLS